MKKTKVYDLPTRIFHWSFAVFFIAAFFIAKTIDDESSLYPYHMLLGFTLVFLVLLRTIWGVVGSRWARFASFPLSPVSLLTYFKGIFSSQAERSPGHNPASAWAAIVMMGLTLGLGLTGYLMTQNNENEFLEEVHELLANGFIIVVLAHVAGIILHTIKHRDNIGLSMIHGNKESFDDAVGITKSHRVAGFAFLGLIGAFVFLLNQNYDPRTQRLNFLGSTLQLGEAEGDEGDEGGEAGESHENQNADHDDDDD